MKKKIIIAAALVLVLAIGFGAGALAAGGFGSASDPLITKSYLDEVLMPELLEDYRERLESEVAAATDGLNEKINALQKKLDKYEEGGGSYVLVRLASGENIICGAGSEIMLRSGSAKALAELTDLTTGGTLAQGEALAENHIYLVPTAGGGVSATASAGALVRGTYEVN